MSLLQRGSFLESPLGKVLDFYNTFIIPRATKRNKTIAISSAIALSFLYVANKLLRPPQHLRHIPYENYFTFVKNATKSYWDKAYSLYLPAIDAPNNNGISMRLGRTGWIVHVANPIDAKYVLMKYDKFPKADMLAGFEDTLGGRFVGGPNLAMLNGAHWKAQRVTANPAFRRSMPVKLFGRLTIDLFNAIDDTQVVDVKDLMERWTLDAIGNAGFGFDFKAISQKDNDWVNTYHTIIGGIWDPKFFLFPSLDTRLLWLFPKRQVLHKELNRFLIMLDKVILAKKTTQQENEYLDENEKDLLSLLMESEAKGDGTMSDIELKSNLVLFFLAGHDTTANALSLAIYYLAKHPEYQSRAREEALAILGDDSKDHVPNVEQTREMPYINKIIKETLRINGPALEVVARVAAEDVTLSGTFIPKGTQVTVDIFNISHSKKVWDDGDQFNPDRFDQELINGSDGYSWLPFGNGPRQCIGMNFSLAEQRVLLSMMLKKYVWTLPDNSIHKERPQTHGITINGPKTMEIKFQKRY